MTISHLRKTPGPGVTLEALGARAWIVGSNMNQDGKVGRHIGHDIFVGPTKTNCIFQDFLDLDFAHTHGGVDNWGGVPLRKRKNKVGKSYSSFPKLEYFSLDPNSPLKTVRHVPNRNPAHPVVRKMGVLRTRENSKLCLWDMPLGKQNIIFS